MKKLFLPMTAVLVMALSFTACKRFLPDNGGSGQNENTPAQVALSFSFDQSADMLKYCDIQVGYDNGQGGSQTILLTQEDLDGRFSWNAVVTSKVLPATFTLSRKVTLKDDISSLEKFTYETGIHYQYALYNAAGERVYLSEAYDNVSSASGKGEKVAEVIHAGKLDRTCTFGFDAEGKLEKKIIER